MARRVGPLALLAGVLAMSAAATGAAESLAWQPRTVLALYKSSEGDTAAQNEIRQMLEFPLNDLGLLVRYHDVERGLPEAAALDGAVAILTWFRSSEMPNATAYLDWLQRQIEQGRKVVVFDALGASVEQATGQDVDWREIERVYHALGVGVDATRTAAQGRIQMVHVDTDLMSFERTIDAEELTVYQRVYAAYPDSRPLLTVRLRDVPESDSHLALLTRAGGVVFGYAYWTDPVTGLRAWHLNPWRFFESALGLTGTPRMDVSVMNGRRLWFMHVDGDGFTTLSTVQRGLTCAETFERAVIDHYGLPLTVSVIVAEIDPGAIGHPAALALARRLLNHPLVEPASHTYAHPHDWHAGILDLKVPGYRYSLDHELRGSVDYVQTQLAPDRPVRLLQASGMCDVPAQGVRALARQQVRVLNSGVDPRYGPDWPSLSGLTPATVPADGVVQYSHRAATDFVLTNHLTQPQRLADVIDYYARTATPRPLVPINVYVHWYSAHSMALLRPLRQILDWSVQQSIAPVWASRYLDIVDGFRAARLARQADGSWLIEDSGWCRTVRFDPPLPGRAVDWTRSQGLLGSMTLGGSLYVFLDGTTSHRIMLTNSPTPDGAMLIEANSFIDTIMTDGTTWDLDVDAPGEAQIVLRSMRPGQIYRVLVTQPGNDSAQEHGLTKADRDGRISVATRLGGLRHVTLVPAGAGAWWMARSRAGLLGLILLAGAVVWLVRYAAYMRRHRSDD